MKNRLYEFKPDQLKQIKRIYVFGDIHGDYLQFTNYINKIDLDSNRILFLGDYADRGAYGVETIEAINGLLEKYPANVIALKGNHEDYHADGNPVFAPCDLIKEVIAKKGDWQNWFQNQFVPFCEKLYIAAIIPGKILFVHGGISNKINSIEDLKYPSPEIEQDILWSDPIEQNASLVEEIEYKSYRGLGVLFGEITTNRIKDILKINLIVRSHQPQQARKGMFYNHHKKVLTINSTSVYGGRPFVLIVNPHKDYALSSEFI